MANLVALDSGIHRNLRVSRRTSREAAEVNVVSVIPREFQRLLAHYPIFFVKSTASGRFEPAALLGFREKENLYFTAGQWDAAYIPLQIQRQPFALIPRRSGTPGGRQSSLDVAVDMSSPQLEASDGERLFLDDGQPRKPTRLPENSRS